MRPIDKFFRKKQKEQVPQQPKPKGDSCKIKITKTSKGKEITFSGKCSKEQIDIARNNLKDEIEVE